MPSISLCVIARDEETFLPGLLQSVRALVDQVVVVDTGSVDQTKNIAESAGALVVDQEWQDDFARARNCALEHATGDWILVLDCDERLSPESVSVIRDAVEKNNFDLGMLALHNAKSLDADTESILNGSGRLGDPVLLPRLIRRTPDLQWNGAIHESISKWMALDKRAVKRIQADILHFGCVPEVLMSRQKDARNLKLLEKRCASEPNNPGIRTHLAQVSHRSRRIGLGEYGSKSSTWWSSSGGCSFGHPSGLHSTSNRPGLGSIGNVESSRCLGR
jgi:glycosyltransferase involved in cell wall biosynthesis